MIVKLFPVLVYVFTWPMIFFFVLPEFHVDIVLIDVCLCMAVNTCLPLHSSFFFFGGWLLLCLMFLCSLNVLFTFDSNSCICCIHYSIFT